MLVTCINRGWTCYLFSPPGHRPSKPLAQFFLTDSAKSPLFPGASPAAAHLARVQQVVDVHQEGLVLDLGVAEQEHRRLAQLAGIARDRLEILAPIVVGVSLGQLQSHRVRGLRVRFGEPAGAGSEGLG